MNESDELHSGDRLHHIESGRQEQLMHVLQQTQTCRPIAYLDFFYFSVQPSGFSLPKAGEKNKITTNVMQINTKLTLPVVRVVEFNSRIYT